jgi:hypothetical protein
MPTYAFADTWERELRHILQSPRFLRARVCQLRPKYGEHEGAPRVRSLCSREPATMSAKFIPNTGGCCE